MDVIIVKYTDDGAAVAEEFEAQQPAYLIVLRQSHSRTRPSVLFQVRENLQHYVAAVHRENPAMPASLQDLATPPVTPALSFQPFT